MIPNIKVIAMCGIDGIESFLHRVHLRWFGHILHMPNNRLPKAVFYGQLADSGCNCGRPLKRYEDGLKATLQACLIHPSIWEDAALDHPSWREMCFRGVSGFERHRVEKLAVKRHKRKTGQYSMRGTLPHLRTEMWVTYWTALAHAYTWELINSSVFNGRIHQL